MTRMWGRRSVTGAGALLLSPTLLPAAVAKPEGVAPGESLAGQLLVATPEMSDPRFRQTVILVVQHDRKGALGVAINRPAREMPLAQLMGALGMDGRGAQGTVRLFAGGPVQPQLGLIVHSAEYRRQGTIDIDGKVAMTPNPQVLRDLARHRGPQQSLIAFGYSGWGGGQLETEIAAEGWFTVPEEPKLVFDFDRAKLWEEAMKRRTISL